jgi:hypothetical protein
MPFRRRSQGTGSRILEKSEGFRKKGVWGNQKVFEIVIYVDKVLKELELK